MSVKRQSRNRIASQPRSFWEKHYRRWRDSGLSKVEYCREHQLYPGTFYNWCHQLAKDDGGVQVACSVNRKPEPLKLIPLIIKPEKSTAASDSISANPGARAQICCGSVSVQLPADLSPELIQHWLGTLVALHAQH
jgi:transposase-like protein